jgi:hypothetical protein
LLLNGPTCTTAYVAALFDAHKRLGVVGMKKGCFARWGKCTYSESDVKFTDPKTGVGFQFVSVVGLYKLNAVDPELETIWFQLLNL